MSRPRVSIGLPVFNGDNFISAAIESLLRQDYEDFELIISDNASTDNTQRICETFAAGDRRIRYYRSDRNIGAAGNYNRVFHEARGEFFKWAAHDDECHQSFISRCVSALDALPQSVPLVYPLAELIDEKGATLYSPLDHVASNDRRPHRRLGHLLWSLNMCDPVFGLIRSAQLSKTGLIGPFFAADYVLLAELAMMGELYELNEVLFRLRAHDRRSMKANRGGRARAAWYDPAAGQKVIVLPGWERMVYELMWAVARSSLRLDDKVRCCGAALGVHYWRRFKNYGGHVKATLRNTLRRTIRDAPL